MDDVASTLLDRLIEKTFSNMSKDERLAFIEKLFADLPSAAQQEFLLKLTRQSIEVGDVFGEPKVVYGAESELGAEIEGPVAIKIIKMGPEDFGPWQVCCQMMNEFVGSPDAERVKTASIARMFTGLADETRLKIVKLLSEREHTVDELVKLLSIAQSTTSHHLRVLKDANLVQGDKRGRSVYYSLVHPLEEVGTE